MTSKYVTASRARHVTHPRVFAMGRYIPYTVLLFVTSFSVTFVLSSLS